jgi:hypothetical protein
MSSFFTSLTSDAKARTKGAIAQHFCSLTGGNCAVSSKDLDQIRLRYYDWKIGLKALLWALNKNGVLPSTQDEVYKAVYPLKKEIVLQTYTAEKGSGEQWSGEGPFWSKLYAVASDPPQSGYDIAGASFRVVGDRNCSGGNEMNPDPVCDYSRPIALYSETNAITWGFTLQGHDEDRGIKDFFVHFTDSLFPDGGSSFHIEGKKATSMGLLTTTYVPSPLTLPPTSPASLTWRRDSGEVWSARGDTWSDWFTLVSPPAPPGYKITKFSFDVAGRNRSCHGDENSPLSREIPGPWTKCRMSRLTSTGVTWQFSLQGDTSKTEYDPDSHSPQFVRVAGKGTITVELTRVAPIGDENEYGTCVAPKHTLAMLRKTD